VFSDTPADYFFSSSPGTKDTVPGTGQKLDTYYVIDMKDGSVDRGDITGPQKRVRCVRTGM
jgi:hypothetical protein